MFRQYKLCEPSTVQGAPLAPYGFGSDGVALHEIIRLLIGNADIEDVKSGQKCKFRINELRLGKLRAHRPARIVRVLFENYATLDDYTVVLNTVGLRNRRFFEHIREELTLCFMARKNRRYTEGFLYLYRILEYISLAFPTLYALSHSNFSGTYNFLKSLVTDGKEGELKILERAVPVLSKSGNLDGLKFDFMIGGMTAEEVGVIKTKLMSVLSGIKGIEVEEEGEVLFRVPFDSMSALFVTLRNRTFHYKIGENNIDLTALGGSETVFALCLDELIYWFALLYTEIVRTAGRQVV